MIRDTVIGGSVPRTPLDFAAGWLEAYSTRYFSQLMVSSGIFYVRPMSRQNLAVFFLHRNPSPPLRGSNLLDPARQITRWPTQLHLEGPSPLTVCPPSLYRFSMIKSLAALHKTILDSSIASSCPMQLRGPCSIALHAPRHACCLR